MGAERLSEVRKDLRSCCLCIEHNSLHCSSFGQEAPAAVFYGTKTTKYPPTARTTMAGDDKKVTVNGSTNGYDPTTQDQITMALLQNGGVKRIQNSFQQRLDEAGWSENLRNYVTQLFRSGEAITYDEALSKVKEHVRVQYLDEEGRAVVRNGAGGPDLVIPSEVAKDAAEVVKKELAKVVKMETK